MLSKRIYRAKEADVAKLVYLIIAYSLLAEIWHKLLAVVFASGYERNTATRECYLMANQFYPQKLIFGEKNIC